MEQLLRSLWSTMMSLQRALARLIRSLGMQVETFASAREFLRCRRPDSPACLILDVRLRGRTACGCRRPCGPPRGARRSSSSRAMGRSPCVSKP